MFEPKYPSIERAIEIASKCIDGLIEDDCEQAMIYFNETCEMTEEEREFFGINEELFKEANGIDD